MNKTAIKAAYNSQRIKQALKLALKRASIQKWPCYGVKNKKGKTFLVVRYNPKQGFTITLTNGKVLTLNQFLTMVK